MASNHFLFRDEFHRTGDIQPPGRHVEPHPSYSTAVCCRLPLVLARAHTPSIVRASGMGVRLLASEARHTAFGGLGGLSPTSKKLCAE